MSEYTSVAVLAPAYKQAQERWKLVDALMDGLDAVMKQGFMKPELNEDPKRFAIRQDLATLTNYYKSTLNKHVGKVFAKDITLTGFDAEIEEWAEDINLEGQNLTQFGRQVFEDGYNRGVTFILTDMHRLAPKEDGSPRTAEDDKNEGVRPYFVHIPAGNVIGNRFGSNGGKKVLTQFHYFETVEEYLDDEFTPTVIKQIKVLRPGSWLILRQDDADGWALYDSGETGLTTIPITCFITRRTINPMVGLPPLEELAGKTLQYFRVENDLDYYHHMGLLPMMEFNGPEPTDSEGKVKDIHVGPNVITYTGDTQSHLKYVEPTGSHSAIVMQRLEQMRQEMEQAGLAPLVNTARTATEANLNSAETNNSLRSAAVAFKDALEQAFLFMNEFYATKKNMGEVNVNVDFRFEEDDKVSVDDVEQETVQQPNATNTTTEQ